MSRRRLDWATESARRIVQLTTGLSAEVQTTYLAAELRLAHQRGTLEASKPKDAVKTTRIGGGLPV